MDEQKTECTFTEKLSGEMCPACGEALRLQIQHIPGLPDFRRRLPCACGRQADAEKRAADLSLGRERLRGEARRRSGIPPRYEALTLSDITAREGQEAAHAAAAEFIAAWQRDPGTGGLLFVGTPGCGKTMVAAALAGTLIDSYGWGDGEASRASRFGVPPLFRPPVIMEDVPHLTRVLRRAMHAGDSPDAITERMAAAPVLILDDIGAEQATEYARGVLHGILDYRWNRCLPLIVTANAHTLEELAQSVGPRGLDRLTAMCRPVVFSCKSQRMYDAV